MNSSGNPWARGNLTWQVVKGDAKISDTQTGPFGTSVVTLTGTDGTTSVFAKTGTYYESCTVRAGVTETVYADFTLTATGILNFPATAPTRSFLSDAAAGTAIGDPVAATHWTHTDTDDDNDVTLIYSLDSAGAAKFSIDANTGQLRTSSETYVAGDTYTFTVEAADVHSGNKRSSDTTTVTITVSPVDKPPTFDSNVPSSLSVNEDATVGTTVGTPITATDPDGGTITYSLSGTGSTFFSIDSNGQISVNAALTAGSYTITVTATDPSSDQATTTVTITVSPVNKPPTFDSDVPSSLSVNEDATVGTTVGTPITATDPNGDTITYSLSGTGSTSFSINSNGQISVNAALTAGSYTITVTATDPSNAQATTTVTITVSASNSPPPQPPPPPPQPPPPQQPGTPPSSQVPLPSVDSRDDEGTTASSEPPLDTLSARGQISFSELMFTSQDASEPPAQWLELYNNSKTQSVNLNGWRLEVEAGDTTENHRHAVIILENLFIPAGQTALIVTAMGQTSIDIASDRVYAFFRHHPNALRHLKYPNTVLGHAGFYLRLSDPNGAVSDVVGSLDGDSHTYDAPAWELPSVVTRDGFRTSLLRRYEPLSGKPLDGTQAFNWQRAVEAELQRVSYWGRETDIGNPGYTAHGTIEFRPPLISISEVMLNSRGGPSFLTAVG